MALPGLCNGGGGRKWVGFLTRRTTQEQLVVLSGHCQQQPSHRSTTVPFARSPYSSAHLWIEQQILRLDIAMADSEGVDVCQGPSELVEVELHEEHRQRLLALVVRPRHAVHRLRYKLQDQVKIQFVRLDGWSGWTLIDDWRDR